MSILGLMMLGAGVGAGVGQLSGGDTKSTMTGMGIGAAVGGGAGMMGFGQGAAAAPGATSGGFNAANYGGFGKGALSFGGSGGSTAATSTGSWLTNPLIPGISASNPLMMGMSGMQIMNAQAQGSTGNAYRDKIDNSAEGKVMKGTLTEVAKEKSEKAEKGNVYEKAAQDMGDVRTAEGVRDRYTDKALNTAQASAGNRNPEDRGYAAGGGNLVRANIAAGSERMQGLFEPTSVLNNYRRNELVDASKHIQNLSNLDNQVGAFQYSTQLANWQTQQSLGAQKGSALGGVASMIGDAQLNQAYTDKMRA
jgi:hypothetical protein